jgi:1-acyl-sn-glycerol-3-phosphate acyltransferase
MKKPYPINPFLRYVVKVWMFIFTSWYRVKGNITPELRKINEPYLLLGNHSGRFDPFIISYFLKKRPNFVSSDAILRDRVVGKLFKGLGAMPIKKGLRDSLAIREMKKVMQAGGAIALYPEGTRTWSGVTHPMDKSIAKLIRFLNVPVITARMRGAYLMDPRWATPIRRAAMEIDFALIMSKEETRELKEEEIFDRLMDGLFQDDIAYQQEKKIKIRSARRAEQVEKVIFQCQVCNGFSDFQAQGNTFTCRECHEKFYLDVYGFISSSQALKFDNLRDWINWQNKNFVVHLQEEYVKEDNGPLFSANGMSIERAIGAEPMDKLGLGEILFYRDRIEVIINDEIIQLAHKRITSLSAQYMERIELFHEELAFRFVSKKHFESGLKWELAENLIWSLSGEDYKVAAYFSELLEPLKT